MDTSELKRKIRRRHLDSLTDYLKAGQDYRRLLALASESDDEITLFVASEAGKVWFEEWARVSDEVRKDFGANAGKLAVEVVEGRHGAYGLDSLDLRVRTRGRDGREFVERVFSCDWDDLPAELQDFFPEWADPFTLWIGIKAWAGPWI